MKFTVRGDELGSMPVQGKPDWKFRKLTLLANDGDFAQQFFELNLESDHAPVGVGKTVEVRVDKVVGLFQGNARISGKLQPAK